MLIVGGGEVSEPLLKIACLRRADSGSFGRGLIIFDEMRTWFKISFLRSQNSTFRNKPPKYQLSQQQQQCRKRENEIKSP
jgi:hypothetical protein